jgi:hypothetical protein
LTRESAAGATPESLRATIRALINAGAKHSTSAISNRACPTLASIMQKVEVLA